MEKVLRLYKYIDGSNDTPFPNVEYQAVVSDFRYDVKRMGGAPIITCTVMHTLCLDKLWSENVYAYFNGERFFIKQIPTSSYNNTDSRYKHELELVSERFVLDNVYFYDVVDSSENNDKPVSNSSKFSFFGDINEFASRLNQSLQYSNVDYSVVVDDGISSEAKMVSFQDQFFSGAIQEGYNTYNVPFYFEGKVIHFGYTNNAITRTFKYGDKESLLSIQKQNANHKIVNRVTGVGSSDNIPYYYPNDSEKGESKALYNGSSDNVQIVDANKYDKLYLSDTFKYEYISPVTSVPFGKHDYRSIDYKKLDFNQKQIVLTYFITIYEDQVLKFFQKLNGADSKSDAHIYGVDNKFEDYILGSYEKTLKTGQYKIVIDDVATIYLDDSMGDEWVTYVLDNYFELEVSLTTLGYNGWSLNGKPVYLKDYGLSALVSPQVGDVITFEQTSYIAPQKHLMPPIYRESLGKERFYNALNNEYQDGNGGYYEFDNPYVDGKPKEHIVNFDYIKPTIKGITNAEGLRIDMFKEFAYDANDNDEVDEEGNCLHPYFFAKLRKFDGEYGFNLFDHSIDESEMTISMTSGSCGGCEFVIGVDDESQKNLVQVDENGILLRDEQGNVRCGREGMQREEPQAKQNDTINNEVWIALKKDQDSFGVVMPNASKNYRPSTNDTFVILHIDLPKAYILAAEDKLKEELIKYMSLNNSEKFNFSISFSRIFFAENPKILEQLNENARIQIEYDNTTYELYISSYSYSMSKDAPLPEIRIELSDTLTISQNALQTAIGDVKNEILSSIGGSANIDILKQGLRYFLRKDKDDKTTHNLGVGKSLSVGEDLEVKGKAIAKKGVQFGESFVPGILTGLGGNIDERGNAELESLVIRRFLEVPELRYNRVEVKLGDKWNASGAGIFEAVFPDKDENGNPLMTGTGWLKLEDGEIGAIAVDDICMGIFHSMNQADNATEDSDDGMGNFQYSGFYTCYFTITEVTGGDNKEFRYKMRPTSDLWKLSIHPSEAMTFVSYGSFTRADRQTSMYQTRTYTRLLKGQNTWEIGIQNIAMQYGDLSNININGESLDGYSLYCNNMYFTGKIQQMKPNGDSILTANDRGEWVQGTKYDFYDRVSHDGGLWLCINESGTNTEPKDGDSSWLCQVKSGQSVTAAGRWESSKVPYAPNSIVTFHEKVFISNKETSAPPFGIYTDKDENRLTFNDGGYILVDTLVQSEDWDLLLDAPDLTNGEDGESLQVRYSSDKSNWHATFVEGDAWMQQRVGDKAQWSDPIRIAGEKGAAGADGTYYDYQFAVNDSLDVAPTTGWQDTPPKVGIGQYLWMRTRFVDPNSQVENPWSVARIGGEKGRGVEKVTEYYQVSSSNTIPPTSWIKDTMPEMTETLKYLWNYEEVAYTDTEVAKTSPIVIGMYSKDGNGIKSVTETYGLTNSAEEQPTKWYADMPIPNKEVRYLWNKTVTEYTEGTPTTIIRIIAVHGETGDSIKAVGAWKSGLEVPALGVVTMAGKTFMAKVATTNPPMWVWTDKETNRIIYKNGGYILTGEMNTEEYDLLVENGKDGADGKDYEYIYIHSKNNTRPSTPASVQIDDNVPNGWHDDPIGVSETCPYEWVCVRTKKDGIWSDYSAPAIWAKFGMDAILADLDNEMDNVALGSDGKTTSKTTIAITASMYYGSTKQTLKSIKVESVSGITSSYVLSTGVVTLVVAKGVTLNERTEVPITLTVFINGKTETRTLKFTLAAVKGGADGKDAVLFDIVTSVSSIVKRKDGSYDVASVSATRTKTVGGTTTETTECVLKYSIDGGAEKEISNNSPISSSLVASGVKFSLYDTDGRLLDRESVPLIMDGKDGERGIQGLQGLQGEQGLQGIPGINGKNGKDGADGKDGQTSYFHIKYANDANGGGMNETGGDYIGTYVDFTQADSTEPKKYTWVKTKGAQGDKGDQGIAGTNGINGETSYLHIAYAKSSDGKEGFSVSDSVGKLYIGQYTDFTQADSTDYTKYKWTLIKGADGKDGVGINSITTTYGKSTSASVMPTSWSGTMPSVGEGEYLWTRMVTDYTDPSKEDTVSYTYTYQGKSGQAGTSVSVKSIQYQAGTSPTAAPTGSWSNNMVSVPQGQYLWSKTTFSDGSVAYGVAKQGEDGKDGEGFTMMGNWKSDLSVPKMGVVTMGGECFAAKVATTNPPLWCWTDKEGNRLIFSASEYILTGELNTSEYDRWTVKGENGKDGEDGKDGQDGKDGESSFKSTVFIRQKLTPATPTGGSYDSPIPTSLPKWEDGIPSGELTLWASTCTFKKGDENEPKWSEPSKMTDTASFEVVYHSSETMPQAPTNYPNTTGSWTPNNGWTDDPTTSSVWMATAVKSNGLWGEWKVSKIKGEKGEKGDKGDEGLQGKQGIQGCIIRKSEFRAGVEYRNDENETSGTRYVDVVLIRNSSMATGWIAYKCKKTTTLIVPTAPASSPAWSDGIPDGGATLWMSTCVFTQGDTSTPIWSEPIKVTDTSSVELVFHSSETTPSAPTNYPSTTGTWTPSNGWTDEPSSSSVWMAKSVKTSGTWSAWEITKIKGEGSGSTFTSTVFIRQNRTPSTPTGGSYDNPIPTSFPWLPENGWELTPISNTLWKAVSKRINGTWSAWAVSEYKAGYDVGNSADVKVVYRSPDVFEPGYAGNTQYWEEFGLNTTSIFTDLIVAKDASIDFVQGNELLIKGSDGITVEAGLSGSSATGGDVRLWVGGETPDDAPFTVDKYGNVVATNATITGVIKGATIEGALIVGTGAYKAKINPSGDYPSITWGDDSKPYVWMGMNTPTGGYLSGQITLRNTLSSSAIISPNAIQLTGDSNFGVEINASGYSSSYMSVTRYVAGSGSYRATLGIDSNNRIRLGASYWPTASSQVNVGEVYSDNGTLKIRMS